MRSAPPGTAVTTASMAAPLARVVEGLSRSSVRSGATDFGWLFLGRLALVGANAATMLLLARYLPLATFGLFTAIVSAQLLLSRFVLMGVGSGMLRLRALPDLRPRSEEVVQAGLLVIRRNTGALLLLAAVATVLAPVTGLRWPAWIMPVIAAGAVGSALVDYGFFYRRARLEFRAAALLQGGTAVSRLALTAVVFWLAPHAPTLIFLAYVGVSLGSGLAQAAVMAWQEPRQPAPGLVRQLVRYSLWTGSADVIAALAVHQGVLLLTWLGQQGPAGHYGLGMTLAQGFFLISAAFNEYVVPRAVQVSSLEGLRRFLKLVSGAALAVVFVCLLLIAAVGALVPRVLGAELHGVVPIFFWLSAAMLTGIVQAPVVATAHYLQRPQILMISLVLRVLGIGALGLVLAPRWGATGMAAAQFSGVIFGAVARGALVGMALRAAYRDGPEDERGERQREVEEHPD